MKKVENLRVGKVKELVKESLIEYDEHQKENKSFSLKEAFEKFEKLPDNEKGKVEPYDWGVDVGKEKVDNYY